MRILKFIINKQIIKKDKTCDFTNIVSGTKGYLKAHFSFSTEWNGCKKAAVFYCLGKEYAAAIIDGRCEIPYEALVCDKFFVSVVGEKNGYRITTNKIRVDQGVG